MLYSNYKQKYIGHMYAHGRNIGVDRGSFEELGCRDGEVSGEASGEVSTRVSGEGSAEVSPKQSTKGSTEASAMASFQGPFHLLGCLHGKGCCAR